MELRGRPAVQGDERGARLFGHPRQQRRQVLARRKPDAELHGHRDLYAFDHARNYIAQQLGGFHQRGPGAGTLHFLDRAPRVHVHEIGAGALRGLGGQGHGGRVGPEQLYGGRVLSGEQFQHLEGFFISVFQALGGHHFRDHQPRAALRREDPESGVGYAGHGGQRQIVPQGHAAHRNGMEELFIGHGFKA